MPKRSVSDDFWGDPFVQDLDKDAKLLFLYLWTNKRCNSAGLYEITLKTITFETGIESSRLPELFKILAPKIVRHDESNLVWVKNFLKNQPQSPQFLKSVSDCLNSINSNGIVSDFRTYYGNLGVSIPYRYPSDTGGRQYRYLQEPEPELEPELEQRNREGIVKGRDDGENNIAKISQCYESNFGMITPALSEELKVLSEEYSADWFEEAVKISCDSNVRKLSYARAILERWRVDGFKADNSKTKKNGKTEPEKIYNNLKVVK